MVESFRREPSGAGGFGGVAPSVDASLLYIRA